MSDNGDERGVLGKLVLSAIVVILALPGLIIEPGPLSEIAALGVLAAIWGFEDVADEATN